MPGTRGGRLTAIIINLFGTVLTIYLLMQFESVLYALMIILFSLSVSATQCRRRLAITIPVLITNVGIVILGVPVSIYMFYLAFTTATPTPNQWVEPITIGVYAVICLLNALIIRNLHFSSRGKSGNG